MANPILEHLRLSGTTYDLVDSTAIHSLDGYWTSGQTNNAITAATGALAETIDQELSGKADTTAVTQEISAAVSGKADTTAVTQAIDEAVSGKANTSDVITNVSGFTNMGRFFIQQEKNGEWTSAAILEGGNGITIYRNGGALIDTIQVDTTVIAQKSDIPSVSGYADAVKYDTNTKYMKFYHGGTGGTEVYSFDASPFLIDGMVDNVEIKDVTISGESVTCLVISFNTAAGKQDINIPISEIFDASNYYTKAETDDEIDAKIAAASGVTTGQVQTMIDQSISGKADTTAVTAAIDAATSGKADTSTVVTDVRAGQTASGFFNLNIYQTKNGVETSVGSFGGFHTDGSDGLIKDGFGVLKVNTNVIQEKLSSGTNIKTVGGNSLLGSGDVPFPPGMTAEVQGTTLIFS